MRRHLETRRSLVFALSIIVVLFFGLSYLQEGASFSSVEVKFADASASGLSIVPASCPSDPHYAGGCDPNPPPPPLGGVCTLRASSYSITAGTSITLTWQATSWYVGGGYSSTYNGGSIAPTVGSVSGQSGSVYVAPTQTTTYVFTGSYTWSHPLLPWSGQSVETVTCDATITVDGVPPPPPGICPDGTPVPSSGICPGGGGECPVGFA